MAIMNAVFALHAEGVLFLTQSVAVPDTLTGYLPGNSCIIYQPVRYNSLTLQYLKNRD